MPAAQQGVGADRPSAYRSVVASWRRALAAVAVRSAAGSSTPIRWAATMSRFLSALTSAVLLLVPTVAQAQDAQGVAAKFIALAEASDAKGLSRLFHYPPDMSEAERHKDAEGVSKSLSWLLSEFGKPTSIQPNRSPVEFYEVGVFGGTNEYWRSRSPIPETQFLYDVKFSNLGPGYFKVLVLNSGAGAGRELHGASFGIPIATPRAKDKAIELMIGLMKNSGTPLPPDFRKSLEEQLRPSRAFPTRQSRLLPNKRLQLTAASPLAALQRHVAGGRRSVVDAQRPPD
jgi:hypothetical protein